MDPETTYARDGQTKQDLVPRPESFGLTVAAEQPNGQITDSVAPPVAPPRLSIDNLIRCRSHRLGSAAALKGEGPGDDASVRGPACNGCGHVDRLVT